MFDVIQHISLGDLPSPDKLQSLQNKTFTHIINVSGIDLFQLYDKDALSFFAINQYTFKDVFSYQPLPDKAIVLSEISADFYLQTTNDYDRKAFFKATANVVESIVNNHAFFLCCHQGIGRSPCVMFAALIYCYRKTYQKTANIIKFLNPKSQLTIVSYSAINWFQQEMAKSNL
jgi:protein-tyrosine phosphatase